MKELPDPGRTVGQGPATLAGAGKKGQVGWQTR
jgi:hypothetical protein